MSERLRGAHATVTPDGRLFQRVRCTMCGSWNCWEYTEGYGSPNAVCVGGRHGYMGVLPSPTYEARDMATNHLLGSERE